MVKKHVNIAQLNENTTLDTIFENKEMQTDDLETKSSEKAKIIEGKGSRPKHKIKMCEKHQQLAYELKAMAPGCGLKPQLDSCRDCN